MFGDGRFYLSYDPQEELAKSGYWSERQVENFKNPAIFWWPTRTYCLNVTIPEDTILDEIWWL
jgi:hypothetical protein